ncbi:MAG: deoxyribonuclease IV [Candidatus Omnitrophota bacterium]|nr:deoxyribonuclease IV [Candidatus Omnitrophota bacterium]
MRLGVHVSIAGHIYEAADRAAQLGCNTFQIFSRNPRGWETTELDPEDAEEFKKRCKSHKISPVVVHIPYLINLCSPEDDLWKKSLDAYIEDIKRADMLGADYFVTHLGSPKGKGIEYGIARFSKGMNEAVTSAKPKLMILLENTAGSGDSLGSKFEHLKSIMDNVKWKLGVCLDTAHAFEAGYNDSTEVGLNAMIKQVDKLIGADKIKVVHFNDSKSEFDSHYDRHWHIGKGNIGAQGMRRIINHPKLKDCAFILETPKETDKDDKMNLTAVRKMSKE